MVSLFNSSKAYRRSRSSPAPLSSLDCPPSKPCESLEPDELEKSIHLSTERISTSGVSRNRNVQDGSQLTATLRKKSLSLNRWKKYFFVLEGGFIHYFSSGAYAKPKESYALLNCSVGKVKEVQSGGVTFYAIKIVWDGKKQVQATSRSETTFDSGLTENLTRKSESQSHANRGLVDKPLENKAQQQNAKSRSSFFGVSRYFHWGTRNRQPPSPVSKSDDTTVQPYSLTSRSGGTRNRQPPSPVSKSDDTTVQPFSPTSRSGDDTVVGNAVLQALIEQQQKHPENSSATNHDNGRNMDSGETPEAHRKSHVSVPKAVAMCAVTATVATGSSVLTLGVGRYIWCHRGGGHFYASRAKTILQIASESMEEILEWKDAIHFEIERINTLECTVQSISDQPNPNRMITGSLVKSETMGSSGNCFDTNKIIVADCIIRQQDWTCDCVENGVRVLIAQRCLAVPLGTEDSFPAKAKPIFMCHTRLNCSPFEALLSLLSFADENTDGFWHSMRVIERIDDTRDIIEVTSEASTLGGALCASPRIFYLARYWLVNGDGNYFLEMTSCWNDASLHPRTNRGLTRGLLRSIYTFTSRLDGNRGKPCLVTHYCQCDPMGLIGYSSAYFSHLYARKVLLSLFDIKFGLEFADFHPFEFDTDLMRGNDALRIFRDSKTLLPVSLSESNAVMENTEIGKVKSNIKEAFFDVGLFHTFKLRGQSYMVTGEKVPGGASVGKLVRCDLFQLSPGERADNISSMGRCSEHVNRLISSGNTLFVMNLQIHKPAISLSFVWKVPDDGGSSAFQALWQKFIDLPEGLNNGKAMPCDDFRSRRFKLLPMIVDGPWIVRKVVGSKPVLLGQKLTCRCFRCPGVFELDIDIHSSKIASNAVVLVASHLKSVIVDLAVAIQGESEDELPESLIGAVRLDSLDLSLAEPLCQTSQGQPGC